ncbi:hypothetical protein [Aureimonas leprariae]|uniref:Uncharacterized protein n=1 Tax=Plantimonas leprariae TaxID=2615207 RepID=A0A7V7PMI6_9HYPH|nr:hypothetical protein [Aureimonas leprariae]KAB0678445.1 hypothetical protein F6X38_15525 [Aureimonas leprariae]
MIDDTRPTLQDCLDGLEVLARRDRPFVICDWDGGAEGFANAEALMRSQPANGVGIGIIAVPAEYVPQMSNFLAVGTVQAAFEEGRPLLCYAIKRTEMMPNSSSRPVDTSLVSDAKSALEISAFTLAARQQAVELSRNTRNRSVTNREARDRAELKIAAAIWQGGVDQDETAKVSRFRGLLDRGRRRVAQFFGFAQARDLAKREAASVLARLADGKTADDVENDILRRAETFARDESRTLSHERAMYRWNRNADVGRPIDAADLIDIVNGLPDRQKSYDLMRLAINADRNPADVHRNLENFRAEFDLGRRIGRLMRGEEIGVSPDDARLLAYALHAARQSAVENKLPETEADACNLYLADAMLEACAESGWWLALINRTLTSGVGARVSPADFPEI